MKNDRRVKVARVIHAKLDIKQIASRSYNRKVETTNSASGYTEKMACVLHESSVSFRTK